MTFDFKIEADDDYEDYAIILDNPNEIEVWGQEITQPDTKGVEVSTTITSTGTQKVEIGGDLKNEATRIRIDADLNNFVNAVDVLNSPFESITGITSMEKMFKGIQKDDPFTADFNGWDVSNVTNMSKTFEYTNFDQDISDWDVSNVTDMSDMFVWSQFNQDISSWDVSSLTNTNNMFHNTPFDQPLEDWDVSNVTNMGYMFDSSDFNQPLNEWDVSSVTNMKYMFSDSSFNQPLNEWDVSSVTNMEAMFYLAENFNQPLNEWDVSNVTNMGLMFSDSSFNQDISDWDVSNVTNMNEMFDSAPFNQDISNWDVSNVTDVIWMFVRSDFNQDISNWDVSNITDMEGMFASTPFEQDLTRWAVPNIDSKPDSFDNDGDNPDWGTAKYPHIKFQEIDNEPNISIDVYKDSERNDLEEEITTNNKGFGQVYVNSDDNEYYYTAYIEDYETNDSFYIEASSNTEDMTDVFHTETFDFSYFVNFNNWIEPQYDLARIKGEMPVTGTMELYIREEGDSEWDKIVEKSLDKGEEFSYDVKDLMINTTYEWKCVLEY